MNSLTAVMSGMSLPVAKVVRKGFAFAVLKDFGENLSCVQPATWNNADPGG